MEVSVPETYFSLVRREPFIVAYWRLNDPAGSTEAVDYGARYDLIGVYSSVNVAGPPLIQVDTGSASSVLKTAKMSVADISQLRLTGDMSIEAWVAPYTSAESVNIASKLNSGASVAGPFALQLASGAPVFSRGNGTTSVSVTASTAIPVSIPSHIVATSFRGMLSLYVDGALVNTALLGALTVSDQGQPLIIGQTSTQNGVDLISEVAVYSGALSARRIARHFAVGQQILSDPAHYKTVDPPAVLI